jgi:hypothetical protein
VNVSRLRAFIACLALVGGLALETGCSKRGAFVPPQPESPQTCEQRRAEFVAYVASLSSRPVVSPTGVELTVSTLGRIPGAGPVVEVSASAMIIDGASVNERDHAARVRRFSDWVATTFAGDPAASEKGPPGRTSTAERVLYVAVGPDIDVQTLRAFLVRVPEFVELRLLVRTPRTKGAEDRGATEAARRLSSRILLESNPGERKRIADEGYGTFATCSALTAGATSIAETDPKRRWPVLRAALEQALPACDCKSLDTASLRLLVSAEQRAGAASLGWVPLSFLRDERCEATMPLRAIKKLVRQIEAFDEEFSAGVDRDALRFGDVVENDRLRVYFCDPLPGEALAAKARAHATLYFRAPGSDACQAWTLDPMALGTPMGTLRRTGPTPLAFHYWQAAEEIRVFGPIDPAAPTKPTDSRTFPCDETLHLTGVDSSSIQLDAGRWFYGEAACQRTRDEARAAGCFGARAANAP